MTAFGWSETLCRHATESPRFRSRVAGCHLKPIHKNEFNAPPKFAFNRRLRRDSRCFEVSRMLRPACQAGREGQSGTWNQRAAHILPPPCLNSARAALPNLRSTTVLGKAARCGGQTGHRTYIPPAHGSNFLFMPRQAFAFACRSSKHA